MSTHKNRLSLGFYIISGIIIVAGLALLSYAFLHWFFYDTYPILIIGLLSGLIIIMYITGFMAEKIQLIGDKEEKA